MAYLISILSLIFSIINFSDALIAYECGNPGTSVTTVSLVDLPECQEIDTKVEMQTVKVAITQTSRQEILSYNRCSVIAQHTVFHCGYFLDTLVEKGQYTELVDLDRKKCQILIEEQRLDIGNNRFEMLSNNEYRTATTWGSISGTQCQGGPLNTQGMSWKSAVRTTVYSIKYNTGSTVVDLESNKVILNNGISCQYKEESCYHPEMGNVYWSIPIPVCDGSPKSMIYKGPASMISTSLSVDRNSSYLHVQTATQDFQVSVLPRTTRICGFLSYYTEHPSLFVTLLNDNIIEFPLKTKDLNVDVDMMLYVNSKFVYVARHIEQQVDKLFQTYMADRCLSRSKISENLMTLAVLDPESFAYQYFGQPGYTSVVRGEVVHITKCKPVSVIVQSLSEYCYNELMVTYENKTFFMRPRSRILSNSATIVKCVPQLPVVYKLDGSWSTPTTHGLMLTKEPTTIKIESLSYKFEEISNLASGGLYSEDSLREMSKTIMSPISESIVKSRLVSSMSGEAPLPDGYHMSRTLSEHDINKLGDEILGWFPNMFNRLLGYGGYVSSILGLYLIVKFVAHTITSVLNFKVLIKDFSFMFSLLCCWFDGIFHHVRDRKKNREDPEAQNREELVNFKV